MGWNSKLAYDVNLKISPKTNDLSAVSAIPDTVCLVHVVCIAHTTLQVQDAVTSECHITIHMTPDQAALVQTHH